MQEIKTSINHDSQELLILNYAHLICNNDGKSLSHTRYDNFLAELRIRDILYWEIYIKMHQFHFLINKSSLMPMFTHGR